MKTKISALIDGELDAHGVREVCIAMRHDAELRRACDAYALIGDALRQETCLASNLAGAVLGQLAEEPVVLAPQGWLSPQKQAWRLGRNWQRPALALAATLAGVAVVAWLGLGAQSRPQAQSLVMKKQTLNQPVLMAAADADMQEYLIAHQLHSGSIYFNGEAQHIRAVSLNEAENH